MIAVTAASRKGLRESLIREGFNDVIGKPIDRFALANLLSQYLPPGNHVTFTNVEAQIADMPMDKPYAPEDNTLPQSPTELAQVKQQGSTSENGDARPINKHILVIEDDEDAAELLQLFLSHLGHTVTTQYCGADALQAAEEQSFDHILMDLTLPDYDGYDLASELKQKLPQAMLTIVSGHEADTEAMSSIGINSALLKPVTKDDLASVVG